MALKWSFVITVTHQQILTAALPGYSSSQAEAAVERIAAQTLPRGIKFEWTDLTYQKSWLVMLDFGYSQWRITRVLGFSCSI